MMLSARTSTAVPLRARRIAPCVVPRVRVAAPTPLVARASPEATPESSDFDAFLIKLSEKFEATENKPLAIGYVAAGVTAVVLSEYLIHLPLLDVLLGFPIQFLGLAVAPWLAIRYIVDKKDVATDANDYWGLISSKLNLPSVDKK